MCFLLMTVIFFQFVAESESQPEIGLVYFLPSDRTAQADIDANIDALIKGIQTVYVDRMETAGYGRKTFTFEKNADGTAKVYRVTGKQIDVYYDTANKWKIWDEIREAGHEPSKRIYIVFVGLRSQHIDGWCGTSGDWLVNTGDSNIWIDTGGGVLTLTTSGRCFEGDYGIHLSAHQLSYAFGLRYDPRSNVPINYTTGEDPMLTSACATEWLDGHPYFNSGLGVSTAETTIEMSSPSVSDSDVSIDFIITDADGLHQAQFFDVVFLNEYRVLKLIACQSLEDSPVTATFKTRVLTLKTGTVALRVMDAAGRSTEQYFSVNLSMQSHHPADVNADGVVNILDLVIVANAFGKDAPDLNGDGVVNILDLIFITQAFEG